MPDTQSRPRPAESNPGPSSLEGHETAADIQRAIAVRERHLARLELQKAEHGDIDVPLSILNGIKFQGREIGRLEKLYEDILNGNNLTYKQETRRTQAGQLVIQNSLDELRQEMERGFRLIEHNSSVQTGETRLRVSGCELAIEDLGERVTGLEAEICPTSEGL